jgi:sRNA-binding carbon storage regulator CsrA
MRDIPNAGNVAVTLRHGQSVVIVDENGRAVAAVAPTPSNVGKVTLGVRAPKTVRILRERDDD